MAFHAMQKSPGHFWCRAHSLGVESGPQMPWSHYLWKDRAASPGHWKGRSLGENTLPRDLPVTWTHLGPWGEKVTFVHTEKWGWLIATNCEVIIIISDLLTSFLQTGIVSQVKRNSWVKWIWSHTESVGRNTYNLKGRVRQECNSHQERQQGFPWWSSGKDFAIQWRGCRFQSLVKG